MQENFFLLTLIIVVIRQCTLTYGCHKVIDIFGSENADDLESGAFIITKGLPIKPITMVSMYEVQIPAANDIKGAWNHEDGTYSIFVEARIVQLRGTVKMQ